MKLEMKDLVFKYDKYNVLNGISGSMENENFYGILGPNGSGKTTWLRLMAGLLHAEKDRIFLDGRDITGFSRRELARYIAFVPQMFQMKYAFTVESILMMGRHPYIKRFSAPSSKDWEIVGNVMRETGLQGFEKVFVNELSGGEVQRVLIARALVQDTPIILLDEPISHLDIHYQQDIIKTLKNSAHRDGRLVVAVLHDMNVALNYCDHLYMVDKGLIVHSGLPGDVISSRTVREVYGVDVTVRSSEKPYGVFW